MRRLTSSIIGVAGAIMFASAAGAADQVMPEPDTYENYEAFITLNGARLTVPFSRGRYRFIAERQFITWPSRFSRRELASRIQYTGEVRGQYEISRHRTRRVEEYFEFSLDVAWSPQPGVDCTLRGFKVEVGLEPVAVESEDDDCSYRIQVFEVEY